jgi:hypothetical protein
MDINTSEILIILVILYHIYYLIDVLRSNFKEPINKLIWLIVIIVLPVLGCVLYMFIGRRQKKEYHLDNN